ncbi:MAG: prenyltransferase/squalene oxidase repeat-containing protein [Myxococcota bacterium]
MSDGPIFVAGPDDAASGPDALKLRAAESLERGHAFVERAGDDEARARARVILEAAKPEEVAALIEARQRSDGAFEAQPGPRPEVFARAIKAWVPSAGVLGCFEALSALAELGPLARESVGRAVDYLASAQNEDGSFGGAAEADARLAGSALLGGLLARSRSARPEGLLRLSDFIAERWNPARVEGGETASLAGHASFFSNFQQEKSDEVLQWCGRELERGFRTRRLETATLLGILVRCDVGMLPAATLAPAELLERLLEEQSSDGGWGALEVAGEGARIEPTLWALRGAVRLCRSF